MTKYLGRLCPHGHEYQNTGQSLRYKSGTHCIVCRSIQAKKYKVENPEKIRRRKKEWEAKNPERKSAHWKKYYSENVEKMSARNKKYRTENKEKIRIRREKFRIENKEKLKRMRLDKCTQLTDVYVRSLLTKRSMLCAGDIPIELIALKREDIKLKRLIKERKDG